MFDGLTACQSAAINLQASPFKPPESVVPEEVCPGMTWGRAGPVRL